VSKVCSFERYTDWGWNSEKDGAGWVCPADLYDSACVNTLHTLHSDGLYAVWT